MDTLYNSATNIQSVHGYSEIYYRIYALVPNNSLSVHASQPSPGLPPTPKTRGPSSKSVNAIRKAKLALRTAGCLVSEESAKSALWIFSTDAGFEILNPFTGPLTDDNGAVITVQGISLQRITSAQVSSRKLISSISVDGTSKQSKEVFTPGKSNSGSATANPTIRNLNANAVSSNAQQTTTSTSESTPNDDQRQIATETAGPNRVIYAKLMDALCSPVILSLSRQKNIIPLNGRNLVWLNSTIGHVSDDEDNYDLKKSNSTPHLLSLEANFTMSGSLLISYTLSPQPRLGLLAASQKVKDKQSRPEQNLNVWLAPSGCVARLRANETAPESNTGSKQNSPIKSKGFGVQVSGDSGVGNWKVRVLDWLESHGLDTTNIKDETWIEVEIPTPYPESSETRTISWPPSFCVFRHAAGPHETESELRSWFSATSDYGDFLGFAQEWLASSGSRQLSLDKSVADRAAQRAAEARHERAKPGEGVHRIHEHTDSMEGFARTPHYLDLPAGNTIYPTPPDGVQPQRPHTVSFTDGAVDDPADAEEAANLKNENGVGSMNGDTSMDLLDDNNLLMTRIDSSMATGLYDASDDEDLFGEMDGDHFDAKGLTEADFSFFDEPSLENLESHNTDTKDDNGSAGQEDVMMYDANQDGQALQPQSEEPSELACNPTMGVNNDAREDAVGPMSGPVGEDLSRNTVTSIAAEVTTEQPEDVDVSGKLPASPPLSPFEVRRKMFSQNMPPPWSGHHRESGQKRRESIYEAVDFGESVDLSDKKYAKAGKFSAVSPEGSSVERIQRKITQAASIAIPTIGLPKRKRNARLNLKIDPTPLFPRAASGTAGVDRFDFSDVLHAVSNDGTGSDSSTNVSELGTIQSSIQGTKRKRRSSSVAGDSLSSGLDQLRSPAAIGSPGVEADLETLRWLSPNVGDGSFNGYFSMRDNPSPGVLPVTQESFSQLSQILVDQISQTSLDQQLDGNTVVCDVDYHSVHLQYTEAIKSSFGEVPNCDLQTYAKLEDGITLKIDDDKDNAFTGGVADSQRESLTGDIFKLASQHVRVRRAKNSMEILPSVLSFWETFSLGPHSGPKDVIAICIHPPTENAREGANAFMDRLGDVYQSCSLGTHIRTDVSDEFKNSMIPWTSETLVNPRMEQVMESLKSTCEALGTTLAKRPSKDLNFVVYIVNPFTQGSATADICAAFLAIFQKYSKGIDAEQETPNELVLQIVPLSFLTSSESLVVPTQSDYLKLALEVYDRCPPKPGSQGTKHPLIQYGPATILAKSIPKTIDFQRIAELPTSLLQDGLSLHLAYAQSLDHRWVTAAWTDSTGSFQITLAYCLRQKGYSISRPLAEVLQDIWETTREIMQADRIYTHLMMVKAGAMTPAEVETWSTLSSQSEQEKRSPFTLTLLTANTNPPLLLFPPTAQLPSFLTSQTGGTFATPVSTPQPAMYSPEAGQPATPAAAPTPNDTAFELDPDAILADASDETWGVVLSHRLNNSNSLVELRPALVSGYLVKRKGAIEQDGYALLGVNVIWVEEEKTKSEGVTQLLRDVLKDFRGLGILTRAKGMVAKGRPEEAVWPWHVATVIKGVRALSYVL